MSLFISALKSGRLVEGEVNKAPWTAFHGHVPAHELLQTPDAYKELVTGSKNSYYRLYSVCASHTDISLISELPVNSHEAATGGML